jgi:phage terminase large subunit-like protein
MRFDPERVMEDRGYGGDWRTESGELLYPELMDERKVVAVERALGPSATRAQLQQDPRRSDSGLFKVPKLKTITREQLPSMDRMVRAWDLAATEGSGCYAAGVLMGIQRKRSTIANYHSIAPASDRFYVLDVAREQTEDPLGFMRRMAVLDEHSWGRVDLAFEAQPGGAGVILTRQIRDHLRQFDPKPIPPRGSKEQRAEGLASSIAFRELTVVEGDFLSEFLAELERFPGMPCDQVDAASLAYVALTVPSKQIVLVAERSTVPRPSEKCQCGDCKRPMFEKSGFCCDLCLQGTARHTPECHAQYNDWFIRQMPTERGTPRSSSIICRW